MRYIRIECLNIHCDKKAIRNRWYSLKGINEVLITSANKTYMDDFILLGFSLGKASCSVLLGLTYIVVLLANLSVFSIIQVSSQLQTPMYFFLRCLSVLDVCYSTVTLPAMLVNAMTGNRGISFHECFLQLYFFVYAGGTESLLLTVMAYDRYVAICNPLRYSIIMNRLFCFYVVAGCCLIGCLNSMSHTLMTLKLRFCDKRYINNFFCDVLPMLEAACSDTKTIQMLLHIDTTLLGASTFLVVMNSYVHIISTILKIHSSKGRQKVFSTCSSHLIVVTVFYITGVFSYNGPKHADSFYVVQASSIVYSVLPPLVNPIIYCLRNNDVKKALKQKITKILQK
ncbi:olfactory receptor 8H1-like [Dendrobates tinctorius]|uniref:olfactory receptor 8H1-like n=1 Tax=Dendrobates tinctorius TaxID=92724 RepID=UPI003CC92A53